MTGSYQQWLRACSLVIADDAGDGVELAGFPGQQQVLRIRFQVHYFTTQTPASLDARVYNLSPQTIQKIIELASKNPPTASGIAFPTSAKITLKAGYENNIGTLFEGQIYQMRVGKENSTDSYIDFFAADGAFAHRDATMAKSLSKGYSATTIWEEAGKSMQKWGATPGPPPDGLSSDPSPRGRVVYGMTRDILRDEAATHNYNWNVVGGQLTAAPKFSVRSDEAIVLNSETGMVGCPEQTERGVTVMCLLNPAIRWGTKLQINEADIQRLLVQRGTSGSTSAQVGGAPGFAASGLSPSFSGGQSELIPPLNSDGIYVVLFASHVGDTRGEAWYTRSVCLSIDPTEKFRPRASQQVVAPPPLGPS